MEKKIAKFTGSLEMDQALDRMLQRTNDGFTGGRVTKHDLVSWVILNFEKDAFSESIDKISQDHFDQVTYLEAVLREAKRARKDGQNEPDLTTALAPLVSQSRTALHRKTKRTDATEATLI